MEGYFVVQENNRKFRDDLRKRLLEFSVLTLKFLMKLPTKKEFDVFRYQLSKSSTAIGANFEEAQSSSYREFVHKIRIALREANESKYWLNILRELEIDDNMSIDKLIKECEEISAILGSIVAKGSKNLKNSSQYKVQGKK